MRILVTGGAGFIGSAVCRRIIAATGHDVLNVDKLTYAGNLDSLAEVSRDSRYAFMLADICDRQAMRRAFSDFRPDAVMHLAAESHVDRSIEGPSAFVETNLVGTYTMLEAARDYWERSPEEVRARFRFLHVSTDEVYGSLGPTGAFTEETPYDPSSPYSATKAGSDHLAVAWQRTFGLPTMISNCSNNYGPYHYPEKLIPLMITNALTGRELPVYGAGANVRDWLYVEDHARALLAVVERGRPGRSYNIGGRAERTNKDVVFALCDILDDVAPRGEGRSYRERIAYVHDRPGHDFRYAIDPSRIEGELGWRAEETFETGLRKTVRWYLGNEAWWRPLKERKETTIRLGLSTARS